MSYVHADHYILKGPKNLDRVQSPVEVVHLGGWARLTHLAKTVGRLARSCQDRTQMTQKVTSSPGVRVLFLLGSLQLKGLVEFGWRGLWRG